MVDWIKALCLNVRLQQDRVDPDSSSRECLFKGNAGALQGGLQAAKSGVQWLRENETRPRWLLTLIKKLKRWRSSFWQVVMQKKTTLVILWRKDATWNVGVCPPKGACSPDGDGALSCSDHSDLKMVQKICRLATFGTHPWVIDLCSGSVIAYSEAGGLEDTTAVTWGRENWPLLCLSESQEPPKSNKVANKAIRDGLF